MTLKSILGHLKPFYANFSETSPLIGRHSAVQPKGMGLPPLGLVEVAP